tara:strand:+ start:364 stop:525 length:162 start_codon:yes stop_codon:yes gene_type:complete
MFDVDVDVDVDVCVLCREDYTIEGREGLKAYRASIVFAMRSDAMRVKCLQVWA